MNVKRKVATQEDAGTYEIGDIESGDVTTAGAVDSARETTIPRAEDRLDSTGLAHLIQLLDARFTKAASLTEYLKKTDAAGTYTTKSESDSTYAKKTAVVASIDGQSGTIDLWTLLTSKYARNYVPADVTNQGWISLGFCLIPYDTADTLKNQPTQWGMLINWPTGTETVAQWWISLPDGGILFRGGNAQQVMNDQPFQGFQSSNNVLSFGNVKIGVD